MEKLLNARIVVTTQFILKGPKRNIPKHEHLLFRMRGICLSNYNNNNNNNTQRMNDKQMRALAIFTPICCLVNNNEFG